MKPIIQSLSVLMLFAVPGLSLAADPANLLEETRTVASAMPPKLLQVMTEEIAKGGLTSAIAVCREKAPVMAMSLSAKTGWTIRRVSLNNRNPKAVPDAWERAVLEAFDLQVANGADAATLEKGEVVTVGEQRTYRYMKALPTQGLCLSCHGTEKVIPADVKQQLQALYPDDKAIGYTLGQVRGAITVTRPLSE
jgi:hypothetical protein